MTRVWLPLALINLLGTTWRALAAWRTLRIEALPTGLLEGLGVDPADVREVLASLPAPPSFGRLWPWLLVLAPLGVLGTWLHHAVWDHTGLWLLGGLKGKRGFKTSLLAEAEALRWAALGTLVGFLAWVPGLGGVLALPLLLLDGYLWLFRGFALAARHGCEPWRGMAATVLHAVLFGGFVLVMVLLSLILARMGA
ncbi:hypothetical protein [Geothrix sp. PMB-07]|uniref:hypothetical protein n=1 Tax=Geothrix sp. PMB-07 TaxID=3068640 RepID=UPI00274073AC|nr:hypothetical protein [Geothrix sp. PMB-07]WLT31552.1 hypothetical protein Q9293_17750 [Geothrix sp. PMB-07]